MRRTLRLPPTCGARSESWIAVVHGPPFPDITDVMQHAKCIHMMVTLMTSVTYHIILKRKSPTWSDSCEKNAIAYVFHHRTVCLGDTYLPSLEHFGPFYCFIFRFCDIVASQVP